MVVRALGGEKEGNWGLSGKWMTDVAHRLRDELHKVLVSSNFGL